MRISPQDEQNKISLVKIRTLEAFVNCRVFSYVWAKSVPSWEEVRNYRQQHRRDNKVSPSKYTRRTENTLLNQTVPEIIFITLRYNSAALSTFAWKNRRRSLRSVCKSLSFDELSQRIRNSSSAVLKSLKTVGLEPLQRLESIVAYRSL